MGASSEGLNPDSGSTGRKRQKCSYSLFMFFNFKLVRFENPNRSKKLATTLNVSLQFI
jgi:hypothetical protein